MIEGPGNGAPADKATPGPRTALFVSLAITMSYGGVGGFHPGQDRQRFANPWQDA